MKGEAFGDLAAQNLELKELSVLSHVMIFSGFNCPISNNIFYFTDHKSQDVEVKSELNHKHPSYACQLSLECAKNY